MGKVEIAIKTEDGKRLCRTWLMAVPNQGHLVTFCIHPEWYTGRVTEVEHNTHTTLIEVTLTNITLRM